MDGIGLNEPKDDIHGCINVARGQEVRSYKDTQMSWPNGSPKNKRDYYGTAPT